MIDSPKIGDGAAPLTDLGEILAGLSPHLHPGAFAYHSADAAQDIADLLSRAVAVFREAEGLSLILPADADTPGAMAWITLEVYSDLLSVGLTAAVASALAEKRIPCNLVAAIRHDHVFVPYSLAGRAMAVLGRLSGEARDDHL